MMRTVWLAVFCLTSLVVLVAIRIGAAPFASADASRLETATTVANPPQATSTKSDKLQVSYIEPTTDRTTVTPVAIVPLKDAPKILPKNVPKREETTIRIVSRHWHDPLAPKASPNVDRSKNKSSKASTR
ncbi:MAG: hypothetical protein JWP25_9124 [Bradyrhizobium sp.]|jgi:hypothetical protein|nr:hypothetical protein [Bradyrhizobium sp.]